VERGEKAIAELGASGGKADFISSDLRDAASARAVARKAAELGDGHVDILINNAGVFPFGPTHETSEASFDDVYVLNVKAPYFLVAELAPLMAQRGKGAIVNVSAMVADYGAAGMSLYGSSKAAINLLTKAWAAEYGPKGVRVNAVSPGPTRTEGTAEMGDSLQQLAAQAPAGRPAAPEEIITEAIVFLATDRASFVQGAISAGRRWQNCRIDFVDCGIGVGSTYVDPEGPIAVACARQVKEHESSYDPASIQRSKEDLDMKNKVLVAGASGLIGIAAIEAFLSAGWEVVGISRRKPDLPSGRDFDFISVDLRDGSAARQALSSLAGVTHVAYAAICEDASAGSASIPHYLG
jgi:NAD(P)-dependent dehydrogenase (short-subunit alcohol dehydrogenase family)